MEAQQMLNASFNSNSSSSASSMSSQLTTPTKGKEKIMVLSVENLKRECQSAHVDLYKENEVDCPKDSFA
jgi:hypothetical protein